MENILFICCNRLDYTKQSYSELLKYNHSITVSVDSPEDGNADVLDYIIVTGGYDKLIVRERNFGCERNIVQSIIECFKRVDDLIIIEDDIIVSQAFFDSIEQEKGKVISGEYAIIGRQEDNTNWFSWGWYITKQNWQKYFYIDNIYHSWEKYKVNFHISEDVEPYVKAQFQTQKRFTWDAQLRINIFKDGKLLYYPQEYTQNIGYQSSNQLRFEYSDENTVIDLNDNSLLVLE